MNNESLVHGLFKFIKEGATMEKLQEANKVAYPVTGIRPLVEGKLPDNPSEIKDPMVDIQLLSEKEKKAKKVTQKSAEKEADASVNKDIETAGSGKTEEPELTDLQKEAAKETPVEKLTQNKDGEDPLKGEPKVKEEKKITPEVSGVEKVKENAGSKLEQALINLQRLTNRLKKEDLRNDSQFWRELAAAEEEVKKSVGIVGENKLPDDPSQIKDPIGDVEKLAEEKCLTTVSDEKVAKDISAKYPGSRIVPDAQGKQYMVMVKEEKHACKCQKVTEATGAPLYLRDLNAEWQAEIIKQHPNLKPMVEAGKDVIVAYFASSPLVQEKKEPVKEDINVTVKVDGEEINVTSTADGIQATKVNAAEMPIDRVETGVEPAVVDEPVVEEDPDMFPGEVEMTDDEAGEMEEKIEVANYLATLGQLTEKQKKFKDEVEGKKIGKKNKAKIAAKKAKK